MRGVLGLIDELSGREEDKASLLECMEKKVRELFDNDNNDKEGNDNA